MLTDSISKYQFLCLFIFIYIRQCTQFLDVGMARFDPIRQKFGDTNQTMGEARVDLGGDC